MVDVNRPVGEGTTVKCLRHPTPSSSAFGVRLVPFPVRRRERRTESVVPSGVGVDEDGFAALLLGHDDDDGQDGGEEDDAGAEPEAFPVPGSASAAI